MAVLGLTTPWRAETRLIADDQPTIEQALIELVDTVGCHLVLTTGGTGPALRDVTPEATLAVADKEMPGFGEEMRRISLNFVPTAILSRQVAVIRKQALIINLPGQPKSIGKRWKACAPPTARWRMSASSPPCPTAST
jgi:molybdopterin adenylyltransferase